MPIEILRAIFPQDLAIVRAIFAEYFASLQSVLSHNQLASTSRELGDLPGSYSASLHPVNGIYLAFTDQRGSDQEVLGCIAIRSLSAERCEVKRLFVRDVARGQGLSRKLLRHVVQEARRYEFQEVVGDTLISMTSAISLYDKFGFHRMEAYHDNTQTDMIFLRLDLTKQLSHL